MRIAITGANGYIGSNLVKKCLDNGYEVTAVDIKNQYIDSRAEYVNIDIFDEKAEAFEKMKSPDVLIHLAWRNGFVHNDISHLEDLPKHFCFLGKMIEKGVKYISVLGSMHEIGYFEGEITGSTPCNPMSLYGISKNALRQSMEALVKDKDVCFHWLRAYYIIGDDLRSNSIFGKLMRKAMDGKKEFPLNSGKNKCDFISIDDLCKQIMVASVQGEVNGIINICSGKPVALGQRVEKYIKENNLEIKLNYGVFPDRPYDSPCVYGNADKINEILKNGGLL